MGNRLEFGYLVFGLSNFVANILIKYLIETISVGIICSTVRIPPVQ